MKRLRRFCSLALCLVFALPLGANAASFSDLSPSHWAYEDMTRAVSLGVINGMGDGSMAPDATLTWGQYLVMLDRAFWPDSYAAALAEGGVWDQAGLLAARENGLILPQDFLPVSDQSLDQPILRRDAAVLLDRVLPEGAGSSSYWWWFDEEPATAQESFSDWAQLDPVYQDSLTRLFDADIVRGRDDGTFGGGETIRRADGSVLLLRTMDAVDDSRYGEDITVTLHFVDQHGQTLAPDQTVDTCVGYWAGSAVDVPELKYYSLTSTGLFISAFQTDYTLAFRPYTKAQVAEADFLDAVERGEASWEDYEKQDFWLSFPGELPQKKVLLFGDAEKRRFASKAEAEANMTTITVPLWRIDKNGNKYAAEGSFSIHSAIAEDTVALFTEIFNDPEQFPIRDLGGYGWRGDSATGEHNCGTAIDINWNENYQVRNGKAETGSYWKPGEDPYSIPADGSVVRIFEEHGWSWGGSAWCGHTDQTVDYHDYMHFSYMGG